MAATLYAGRIVSAGTLVAVILSTSDEMVPVFLAHQEPLSRLLSIIGFKMVVGIVVGFAVDIMLRLLHRAGDGHPHIRELCERAHCHCGDMDEADEPAEPVSDSETREEALREVERLMDERLSPLQRRVMEMREYEGLAVADIARRLDMQETAVRMNLSRARQALREMMKHSENR